MSDHVKHLDAHKERNRSAFLRRRCPPNSRSGAEAAADYVPLSGAWLAHRESLSLKNIIAAGAGKDTTLALRLGGGVTLYAKALSNVTRHGTAVNPRQSPGAP